MKLLRYVKLIRITPKSMKARKLVKDYGDMFNILVMKAAGQFLRTPRGEWSGWLYDDDVDYEERTELRMNMLKGYNGSLFSFNGE